MKNMMLRRSMGDLLILPALALGLVGLFSSVQAAQPAQSGGSGYPALAATWDSHGELVGYYEPEDLINSAWERGGRPAWLAFEVAADRLGKAISQQCRKASSDLGKTKPTFHEVLVAFEHAAVINQGPMFETKVTRWVNFQPVRAALIEKTGQREGAIDIDKVGAPAKGLPALEWLLFNPEASTLPEKRRCEYAQAIVVDLQTRALATVTSGKREEPTAQVAYNQILGGLETFYWDSLKKPLTKVKAGDGDSAFLWTEAGFSTQAIKAAWLGLRPYLVIDHDGLADPEAEPLPLGQFLKGLGKLDEADTLRAHVLAMDNQVAKLIDKPAAEQAEQIEMAEDAFDDLLKWYKHDASKAMRVSVGFSSADGD